jgi:DNA-binding transcriptional regulator GbsR (MarR family)
LMRSKFVERTFTVGKHKISFILEDEFWTGLKEIAAARQFRSIGRDKWKRTSITGKAIVETLRTK